MTSPNFTKCCEKTAFVVGHTGDVGKELVKELLEKRIFKKLFLIGRRSIEYSDPLFATEQKVVDFDHLEDHKEAFRDVEYGFCCLGTSRAAAGVEGFVKVDHDYVVNTAKVAKQAGCQRFALVTADNANKDSRFLYPRTKGLAEQHVTEVGFQKLTIARPAFIISETRQPGIVGKYVVGCLMKPLIWAKPKSYIIPVKKVAKAMIYSICTDSVGQSVDIMRNQKLHEVADYYEKMVENKQ